MKTLVRILCIACMAFIAWHGIHPKNAAAHGEDANLPKEIRGLSVEEKLNARLPMDLRFQDENGRNVSLRDIASGGMPFILTLNYFHCPVLCNPMLTSLARALRAVPLQMGGRYRVVTLSIDPGETPEIARQKKNEVSGWYDHQGMQGWSFFTGREENIRRLANSTGFRYRYDPKTKQFYHPAVLMICTPGGRISRYVYGVQYDPRMLRLSIVEASEGKSISTTDRILLFCYHYDAASGRYVLAALNFMRAGGALTLLIMVFVLGRFWLNDARKGPVAEGGET